MVKEYASAGNTDDERRYSPATCTSVNKRRVEGNPDLRTANTSYVERSNLTIRMGNRRFTRLTNGFSKKIEKHVAMLSLYFLHYNFCRQHKTLRVTPAMEAGLSDTMHDMAWIVGLIDARAPEAEEAGTEARNRRKAEKVRLIHYRRLRRPCATSGKFKVRHCQSSYPLHSPLLRFG